MRGGGGKANASDMGLLKLTVRLLTTGRDGWSCGRRVEEGEGEGKEKKKARTGSDKNNNMTTRQQQSKQVKRRLRA